jgi:hypothetical protein
MMHVAIRRYRLLGSGSADEVLRRITEGFIPIIKDAPGFLAYYALDGGGGTIASISIFEHRAGAEESNRMAADWVRENLASMLPNPPEIIEGEVGAHELNLARLGIREVRE